MRTRDDDNVYGDSNYDLILSDWKDVGGGAKRAHTLSFQLNGVEVQRLTLKQVTLDPPIPPDTFAVSEDVKAKAKTAASEAPHQWVLRCIFLGCFLDSDKIYYPENGGSGRAVAEYSARGRRLRQQPDRGDEGRHRNL